MTTRKKNRIRLEKIGYTLFVIAASIFVIIGLVAFLSTFDGYRMTKINDEFDFSEANVGRCISSPEVEAYFDFHFAGDFSITDAQQYTRCKVHTRDVALDEPMAIKYEVTCYKKV